MGWVHAGISCFVIGVYCIASNAVMGEGVVWYNLMGSVQIMVDNGDWYGGAGVGRYWLIFIFVVIFRPIFISCFMVFFCSVGWEVPVRRVMVGFPMLVKICL